jgi:hypothetical protein
MVGRKYVTEKKTQGIDPGTVRLVAQRHKQIVVVKSLKGKNACLKQSEMFVFRKLFHGGKWSEVS